ncbi:DNA cytosine methyltransferase [Providencia sp. wls1916]|nr:hypothetical protein [Providencia sp. wls1916]
MAGILHKKHSEALSNMLNEFSPLGFNVSYQLLDSNDYNCTSR